MDDKSSRLMTWATRYNGWYNEQRTREGKNLLKPLFGLYAYMKSESLVTRISTSVQVVTRPAHTPVTPRGL